MSAKKRKAVIIILLILLSGVGGGFLAQKDSGGNWLLGFMLGINLACFVVWFFWYFTKSGHNQKEDEEE